MSKLTTFRSSRFVYVVFDWFFMFCFIVVVGGGNVVGYFVCVLVSVDLILGV